MTTRHITTSHDHSVCDVCGRTLLRGEQAEVFLDGPRRYSLCELCKPHALHEGWVREGTIPDFQGTGVGQGRRRSLLGRLRGRPTPRTGGRGDDGREFEDEEPSAPQTLDDELSVGGWPPVAPEPAPVPARLLAPEGTRSSQPRESSTRRAREPRRVHAVPTGEGQKIAAALNAFNRTEYTRTIASVSRSLGVPQINVTPEAGRPGLVRIVATWELCWYRYEVDLSDNPDTVRLDAQGYELEELSEHELQPNAAADDAGRLYYE